MLNRMQSLRLSLAVFAVIEAAAHLFPSPSGSMLGQFWFNIEVIVYAVLAVAFILGLKRWYLVAVGFSLLNVALFVLAGVAVIPGVTSAPLTDNLSFAHYDTSRFFSVISYAYLIVFGLIASRLDRGSKLEKLY